uniref:NADH dehydrogenase subunit 2 n=1 Tax=Sclerodermus sichuanensis TaxID=592144 RepID=UPI00211475CA|nr:NADH dehydrogenase subunit 2 [Sclerodermus sichuanensis]UTN43168.1 NADH dehydrogenase subunit 2 [Sclerodermus sichuanensis]
MNKMKMMSMMIFYLLIIPIFFSNSPIIMWMLYEFISMMFMFQLMNFKIKFATVYYIIQTISSNFILLLLLFLNMFTNYMYLLNIFILFFLMIKLGLPPFQKWFIMMMKNLSWNLCFILSTLMKLIPLFMMTNFLINQYFILIIMSITSIMLMMFMYKQINLKMLFSFSSLNHNSWIIMSLLNSNNWIIYMFMYIMMMFLICKTFMYMNINSLFSLTYMPMNLNLWIIIISMTFSMSGMPPLSSFILKWIVLNNLNNINFYNNIIILTMLMLSSTFALINYLMIIIPMMFRLMPHKFKLNYNKNFNMKKMNKFLYTMIILTSIILST